MIRELDIKVYFDLPQVDYDKYFDIMVPTNVVEERLYDQVLDMFCDNEGFRGVRVDCNDSFFDLDEKRRKLSLYVGCDDTQTEGWDD